MRSIFLLFTVLFVFTQATYAQNRTVTGVVTGADDNQPLIGVTVKVKGSTAGTATDANGKYSIKVTNLQNVVIGVTYVGYAYQEATLKPGETVLNFKMQPSENNLNEVVVVGYGEQKKATLTGAISTIDLKKIEDIPALNLASSLVGQVPGLSVGTGSQRPGQPVTLTVRNPVSYSPNGKVGTNPLYVIDDQIRTANDFNLLDQNEVESISVLKDAEAAVYGINGANGVILVRTKKGKIGAPKISFSSSISTESARQLPKMMSGYDLAVLNNDYNQVKNNYTIDANGYIGGSSTNKLAAWYTPDELAYFQANSTNYLDQAFSTATAYREAINVSGGTDKVTYFVGGDYVNQNSNFAGVNSNKWGLRASVEAKPAKGLTATLNLNSNVSYTRSFWYKFKSTSESLDNDVLSLVTVQPWQQYFIDGNPVLLNQSATNGGNDNINVFLFENSNNYTGGTGVALNALMKLNYEIPGIKGLSASVSLNENLNNQFNKQYGTSFNYYRYSNLGSNNHIPGGTIVGSPILLTNGDKVRLNPSYTTNYQFDAAINYNRSFGLHKIVFLGLYEQREIYTEGVAAEANGVITSGKDNQNFTTSPTQLSNQASQISSQGYLSYLARLNYSYADKYLLQLVTRVDGSYDFLPGKNYGYFPSAEIGWVASNEKFIKDRISWIDQLKFRASIGLTGSDNTPGSPQYQPSYKFGTGNNGGAVFGELGKSYGIQLNLAMANPEITWDHTLKTDYGVDMQFLKSRLNFSFDYFWNHGYDLLTGINSSVPATVAATLPLQNYNVVNTFGYELSLGWRDHVGKSFNYSFTPFFTWSDNKVLRIDQTPANVGTFQDPTGGSSDKGVLGYHYTGFIRTQADADAVIAERSAAAGGDTKVFINGTQLKSAAGVYALGILNYQDLNGDGVIDGKDVQYIAPKSGNHYNLGLNWSVSYKSLSLAVTMGMSWGGQNVLSGNYDLFGTSSTAPITENKPVYWVDHWTRENPNAKYPNPAYASEWAVNTEFWFINSFSWNISHANLSYSLPQKWISKIGMSNARLYADGFNLLSLVNPYPEHFRDPQTAVNSYPALRQLSFGLNVTF
jgi:TonB-linked SusC/RagA family outer membrane protein